MALKTLTIIEPDEKLLTVLTLILEEQGLRVIGCADLPEAIRHLEINSSCDYLLTNRHQAQNSVAFLHTCDQLGLPRPRLLKPLDLSASELPDLQTLKQRFSDTI